MRQETKSWFDVLWGAGALCALVSLGFATGCNPDPGPSESTPNYKSVGDPDEEGNPQPSSSERGNMMITEIGWAGSVTDDGVHDPDDVFIEIQNKNPRPVNMHNWRLIFEGDIIRTIRLVPQEGEPDLEPVAPNDFFVIAAKKDGAFGERADLILPDLELGKTYIHLELRDADRRLMEGAGSDSERIFTGGWDTYSTRSMERVQIIFGNQGGMSRNWHAYSEDVGHPNIAEGYRQRTLASPGVANSQDYSGSATAGGFE